jgi:hypothetical protein
MQGRSSMTANGFSEKGQGGARVVELHRDWAVIADANNGFNVASIKGVLGEALVSRQQGIANSTIEKGRYPMVRDMHSMFQRALSRGRSNTGVGISALRIEGSERRRTVSLIGKHNDEVAQSGHACRGDVRLVQHRKSKRAKRSQGNDPSGAPGSS